ncbi:type II toxin-antitoxin system MqsR family toxin [Acidithiobacillus sp. IBUN Pt1247-S3]|uniref:type II toxin-antitoxin system MqsR family toxin n=1 Tax=Acidithiobacillus sp. IBUN Pt1247-S3 TaxID=3166642 RepID=UPI0034E4FA5B
MVDETTLKGYCSPMEKRRPHYRLTEIQNDVRKRGVAAFTLTAQRNGLAMGLTTGEMVDVVCGLTRVSFYKSMTTIEDPRLWQDVYHATVRAGKVAYIKITGFTDEHPPVIQFKEK